MFMELFLKTLCHKSLYLMTPHVLSSVLMIADVGEFDIYHTPDGF